jgi:peptidoglycan/xylan/chitin deacetylase (PgdA/CDA1 family)
MYHYVRDFKVTSYPGINGLDIRDFLGQLDFISKYYNVISLKQLNDHYHGEGKLPPKALLLTFDDGYADHFQTVFPALLARGMIGSFFIPTQVIYEGKLLSVNKIHFILATCSDKRKLVQEIFQAMDLYRQSHELVGNQDLFRSAQSRGNRFDSPEVLFIKQALQVLLPRALSDEIVDTLLEKYTRKSESELNRELYVNEAQVREMRSGGMEIGAHGWRHLWLNSLGDRDKELEIARSAQFLEDIGVPQNEWTFCYPYGAYDTGVIQQLSAKGFRLGFTTHVRVSETGRDGAFSLPRLDTNDLPKKITQPNQWYYDG